MNSIQWYSCQYGGSALYGVTANTNIVMELMFLWGTSIRLFIMRVVCLDK
jgi:hypothetical protein